MKNFLLAVVFASASFVSTPASASHSDNPPYCTWGALGPCGDWGLPNWNFPKVNFPSIPRVSGWSVGRPELTDKNSKWCTDTSIQASVQNARTLQGITSYWMRNGWEKHKALLDYWQYRWTLCVWNSQKGKWEWSPGGEYIDVYCDA